METGGTAALAALVLCLIYLGAVLGVQSWRQWARTGRTGWVPVSGRPRPEVLADVLFVLALGLDVAAPTLALFGLSRPIAPLNRPVLHAGGEPHLLDVHGQRYRRYAARVGRLLPRLGRTRSSA